VTTSRLITPGLPILEGGDRLSRAEFERRYQGMPEVKKAELIEGVVYVASPLRYRQHGRPHRDIMTWLGVYGPQRQVLNRRTTQRCGWMGRMNPNRTLCCGLMGQGWPVSHQ
jgi:hypothetical protein